MGDTEEYNAENLNYEAEGDGAGAEEEMEDPELEDIKARVRAMEEEAEKLKLLQSEVGDFVLHSVLGIRNRIRRIRMFSGLPDPDSLVRGSGFINQRYGSGSGSAPKCHGCPTLVLQFLILLNALDVRYRYLIFGTRLVADIVS
jgi:hypothetical protein